jgi:hypothetical protein
MARWLERDPAGYQDGPSLYSYLGRNPMAGTDPSGRWVNIVGGAVIGAAIGGIAAAIDGEGWDGIARNAAKGAVVGAVAGATFGIGLAAAGVTTTATVAAAGGLSGMAATATGALLEGRAPTAEELIWGGLFGGATAGTFHGAFGVGRAGLGAIWGKRSAQPGGVARPGPDAGFVERTRLEVQALQRQGMSRDEAFSQIRQFNAGDAGDWLFHFTTPRGARGIVADGLIRPSQSGVAGPGVYLGTTPTPSWFLKNTPFLGWGLGGKGAAVRIPVKTNGGVAPLLPPRTRVECDPVRLGGA